MQKGRKTASLRKAGASMRVRNVRVPNQKNGPRNDLGGYRLPHRHSSCPLLLGPPSPPLPPALNPFSVLPWMHTKSGQGKTSDPNPYYQGFNPVILPMLLSLYFGSKSPHWANPRVAMLVGSYQPSTSSTHSLRPLERVSVL